MENLVKQENLEDRALTDARLKKSVEFEPFIQFSKLYKKETGQHFQVVHSSWNLYLTLTTIKSLNKKQKSC